MAANNDHSVPGTAEEEERMLARAMEESLAMSTPPATPTPAATPVVTQEPPPPNYDDLQPSAPPSTNPETAVGSAVVEALLPLFSQERDDQPAGPLKETLSELVELLKTDVLNAILWSCRKVCEQCVTLLHRELLKKEPHNVNLKSMVTAVAPVLKKRTGDSTRLTILLQEFVRPLGNSATHAGGDPDLDLVHVALCSTKAVVSETQKAIQCDPGALDDDIRLANCVCGETMYVPGDVALSEVTCWSCGQYVDKPDATSFPGPKEQSSVTPREGGAKKNSQTRIVGRICNMMDTFAFISCPEQANNVFFHLSEWESKDTPESHAEVSFILVESSRGPQARDVKPVLANKDAQKSGIVHNYNTERGFGFITPDRGGDNVFFHSSQLDDGRPPALGDRVTYTEAWNPSGTVAENVRFARPARGRTGGGVGGGRSGVKGRGRGRARSTSPRPGAGRATGGRPSGSARSSNKGSNKGRPSGAAAGRGGGRKSSGPAPGRGSGGRTSGAKADKSAGAHLSESADARETTTPKLPPGYERRVTLEDGKEVVYYVNHNTKTTSWHAPGPDEASATRVNGTVEKVQDRHGFISPDDGSGNVFFHFSECDAPGRLVVHTRVSYVVRHTPGETRPSAHAIKRL